MKHYKSQHFCNKKFKAKLKNNPNSTKISVLISEKEEWVEMYIH